MIDSRAVIDSKAQLDEGVSVGPFSVIGPNVHIASGTWIGPHVVINGPTHIGRDNRIFQFASVGDIPQDKKYRGEESRLTIGDRNTIREYCTINRGTELDRGETSVGNDNWIMAYVHIAHDCQVGNHIVFSNGTTLAGHVIIEDHAVLGGFTLVHQFCRIGTYSFCGMGTALNRDLPPYVMASGNLGRPYGLNKEGLKRSGFSADTTRALHKAYMMLVGTGAKKTNDQQQLDEFRMQFPEVDHFVEFIENSPRGIIREVSSG